MNDAVQYRFVADVHLGKLVKWLRLLGFNTLYNQEATPAQLIENATVQDSILLSKSVAFTRQTALPFFLITSSDSMEQLQQVIRHFHLIEVIQPFTRCLICNGHLQPIAKAAIQEQLQPDTIGNFNRFWQCGSCKRVYWEGSHYERMLKLVKSVKLFQP